MKSLKSISIFDTQITKTTPPGTIISLLSDLRLKMNYQFFTDLSMEDKGKVINYLWNRLHNMWRNGPHELKNPTATTVGSILVRLAPFYTDDLMKSLVRTIRNYNGTSILYFSCFCYLSKFYSPSSIEACSKDINLFHLVSVRSASALPKMTKELFGLPNQMLRSLLERYIKLLNKDPENSYIAQAAHVIISQSPESYVDLITEDLPIEIITGIFGDKLPILNEKLVKSISDKALHSIQDFGTPLRKFSASCKILSILISNKQVPPEIVHGIFTKETILKNSSLEDILLLPIEPSVIFSIYGNQNFKTNLVSVDGQVFESNGFIEDSSALLQMDNNSNPNISSDFDFNTYDDVYENPEMMTLINDGNTTSTFPGSLAPDIRFLPSLPLPDYPTNSNQKRVEDKKLEKVPSLKPVTAFDEDSGSNVQSDMNLSKSIDFSSVPPPPTIPGILGGSDMNLQSSLVTKESNSEEKIVKDKKPIFVSPEILKSKSDRRITHRLSLDMGAGKMRPNAFNSTISKSNGLQKEQKSGFLLRLNPKYVSPLINYFKRYPEYQNELCNLILYSISLYKMTNMLGNDTTQKSLKDLNEASQKNDAIYSAIKAIKETHVSFQPTTLNKVLEKLFDITSNDNYENEGSYSNYVTDLTLNAKTLEMIGTLQADRLTKKTANKMFEIIEKASISKIDILRKKAKKAFVSLSNQTSSDLFKFFFDIYIQKLDLFNEKEFQGRLSFIAYTMHHVSPQLPLSFSSITTFLYEALTLNGSFHRNNMMKALKILSVFAPTIDDPQILVIFIQHAMNMIRKNFSDYTGYEIGPVDPKATFFNNHYSVENTLVQVDTNLVANPRMSHRNCLKCAHIAYAFLATVPWDRFELTANDKLQLEQFMIPLSILLPKETSTFLLLLRDYVLISANSYKKIIANLCRISRRRDDIITFLPLYRFICKKGEVYKQMNIDLLSETLLNFLPRWTNITQDQAFSVKMFLADKQVDITNIQTMQKVLNSSSSLQHELNKMEDPTRNKDASDEYEDYDNDDDEGKTETNELLNDQELSSFMISLTPLIYANLDVPPEFLQPFQIRNFCLNSPTPIDEDQCKQLFHFAISNSTSRILYHIIRYANKMHYNLNIEDHLDNPLLNTKRLFSPVFFAITYKKRGFQNLSHRCNQYIKQFFPIGYVPYVLNASEQQRNNAIRILQFDPLYFISQFSQVENFTRKQLINLCIYIQNVKFPREAIFKFVIELLSKSSKYQSSINVNIVRRIMTLFIACYGNTIRRASKQIYDIVACELGFPIPIDSNSATIRKLTAAEFTELGYTVGAISPLMDCKELTEQVASVFTKSSPNYLILLQRTNEKGSIDHISDGLNSLLPSIRYHTILYVARYLKKNLDFNITSDFINNTIKLFDLYVPIPTPSGQQITRIMNDDSSNCFFCFVSCVLSHELSSSIQKMLYNMMYERMNFEVQSFSLGRFISLYKAFTNQNHLKNDLYNDIFHKCTFLVEKRALMRPFFVDIYSSVARQVGKQKIFNEKMINFMMNKTTYDSYETIEIASIEIMKSMNNTDEAANVLTFELPDFFNYFIAISSIEKKNRSMVHDKLQKKYKGTHLLALQMLKDPKFRIFSPLVAYIENDIEVPPKLKEYLDSIGDKIQREYVTDTYHEF